VKLSVYIDIGGEHINKMYPALLEVIEYARQSGISLVHDSVDM